MTSHDVVAIARKTLHERKIGHLGTLDPAASGLMVLAVGKKALKTIELFEKQPKTYLATICFGETSSTYDSEGVLTTTDVKPGWPKPTEHQLSLLLKDHFTGDIQQVPPAHSALHINGERAYKKARRGEQVNMPTRDVTIHHCSLKDFSYPNANIAIGCSSGTYIRSIAHDIGQHLRFGAYLRALHRTTVGQFSVNNSVTTDSIDWKHIIPLKQILKPFTALEITPQQYIDFQHGKDLEKTDELSEPLIAWCEGLPVALLETKAGLWHPRKVF